MEKFNLTTNFPATIENSVEKKKRKNFYGKKSMSQEFDIYNFGKKNVVHMLKNCSKMQELKKYSMRDSFFKIYFFWNLDNYVLSRKMCW